jgi:formylglycine-generating enzyme required for sulfatase activity
VNRGGCWNDPAKCCRSAVRQCGERDYHGIYLGFRVSLVPADEPSEQAAPSTSTTTPTVVSGASTAAPASTGTQAAGGTQPSRFIGPDGKWKLPPDAPVPAIAPFGEKKTKEHQDAWAKHLAVPVEHTNTLGMKFILIPPGEFTMGSTPVEIDEALNVAGEHKHWQECVKSTVPQHKVILTQPIYLGVHEVTQSQYERVMGQNPSHFAATGPGKDAIVGVDTSNYPVEMVSWNDAAEFCAKLSEKEKLKPFYFRAGETVTMLDGTGYRLPTEAEWEFAGRAGTTTKYWIGDKDDDLPQAGWFNVNSGGRTHAVGELKANPFGLFDIHGNVWEWVQDWWEPTYYGQFQKKSAIDPNGPSSAGSPRVIRGGYWGNDHASDCRASYRHARAPTLRGSPLGFRVALVVGVSPVGRP